ncbi:MAG: sigma-54 dependent transcriptional regulator [Neisseria sp.]|nr:sigma-54 dependent transcriptional regulator [Neisseria sp.]
MRSSDILIVDDEIGIRDVLSDTLQDEGYTVCLAENAEEARQLRNQTRPAMVLLDIWMPDCDGITLLKEWANNGQLTMPVVMMSGHASIDTAVEATKIGALDFLEKPITLKKLLSTVERALKVSESQQQETLPLDKLGNSPAIQEMNRWLSVALGQNQAVLFTGQAGSPFDVLLQYFHKNNAPCHSISKANVIIDTPMELLQKAAGGILYLPDIAQYSKNVQKGISFLLSQAEKANVRIIASCPWQTNAVEVSDKLDSKLLAQFTHKIALPTLNEQANDLPFLINKISSEIAESQRLPVLRFSERALQLLCQHHWIGNYAQLYDSLQTLALNQQQDSEVSEQSVQNLLGAPKEETPPASTGYEFNFNLPLRELREQIERHYFQFHIEQEEGNMSKVAQKVGLERTHLYRKLKQLDIQFARRGKGEE